RPFATRCSIRPRPENGRMWSRFDGIVELSRGGPRVQSRACLVSRCLLLFAIALYGIAFVLPAYKEPQSGVAVGGPAFRVDQGYVVFVNALILGWPAWYANPAFWIAVGFTTFGRVRSALISAIVAFGLALSAIPMATVFSWSQFYRLQPGYWTWLAACATLLL